MANWLDPTALKVLEKGLDVSSLRQRVLSNNIANVDTAGFKRNDVDFQKALDKEMGTSELLPLKQTLQQHLPGLGEGAQDLIVTDPSSIHKNGNNVDIDREMANVAENNIYYSSLSRTTSMQLGILRLLINQKS